MCVCFHVCDIAGNVYTKNFSGWLERDLGVRQKRIEG